MLRIYKKFNIIGITETWIDEKGQEEIKNKLTEEFKWKCQKAIEEKKNKRIEEIEQ